MKIDSAWVREHAAQVLKFGLAGGSAAIVDFTVFNVVIAFASVDPRYASFFSTPLGLLTVFLMNKFVTFRKREGKTLSQVIRFGFVYGLAVIMNIGLTALFITLGVQLLDFSMTALLANISKAIAVGCVMFWNYTMLHLFVFASRGNSETVKPML